MNEFATKVDIHSVWRNVVFWTNRNRKEMTIISIIYISLDGVNRADFLWGNSHFNARLSSLKTTHNVNANCMVRNACNSNQCDVKLSVWHASFVLTQFYISSCSIFFMLLDFEHDVCPHKNDLFIHVVAFQLKCSCWYYGVKRFFSIFFFRSSFNYSFRWKYVWLSSGAKFCL